MLLSMFISYRMVGYSRKTYLRSTALFIIFASFFSTFFTYVYLWVFLYPFGLLSFPFSSTVEQMHSWAPVTAYNIHFLTLEIVSIAPEIAPIYGFLFFLSVNFASAILGYWIGKRLLRESLKRKLFDFFFKSSIYSFIACFFIFWITFFAVEGITGGRLNHYLNDNTMLFAIGNLISLFCIYFFWIPAAVATTIYGISSVLGEGKYIYQMSCLH